VVTNIRTIVIIPAYHEEGKVGKVVTCILNDEYNARFIDEVLVVDDGSRDKTKIEAERAGATVISHKRNRGVSEAIRTGIEYAVKKKYDVCVIMGADTQDDPSEIKKLVKPILNGECDFVQGSRYLKGQRTVDMPVSRSITTRIFTLLFRLSSGFPATDASNGFRAFKTDIFKKIEIPANLGKWDLEPYLYLQAVKKGLRVKEVPVTKKYDLQKGFSKMQPITSWISAASPMIKEILHLQKS